MKAGSRPEPKSRSRDPTECASEEKDEKEGDADLAADDLDDVGDDDGGSADDDVDLFQIARIAAGEAADHGVGFAQLQQLSQAETLACFGKYYREDVLQNPEGDDHQKEAFGL